MEKLLQRWRPWADRLEYLFLAFLFVNPVLDILNGIEILAVNARFSEFQFPITPTLLIRMIFLMAMGTYLLLRWDKKSLLTAVLVGIAGIMSMAAELFFAYTYDMFLDFQYIARFLYNILVLLVYSYALYRNGSCTKREVTSILQRFFAWSGFIIGLSIIVSFLTGFGFFTYQDRFGRRGTSGFYFSANEAAALLMVLLPVCIYLFMQVSNYNRAKNWITLLASPLAINALLLIGTKTAFIALIFFIGAIFIYVVSYCIKHKKASPLIRFCAMLLFGVIIFGALTFLSNSQTILTVSSNLGSINDKMNEEFTEEYLRAMRERYEDDQLEAITSGNRITQMIFSGRDYYLIKTARRWLHAPFMSKIFGLGRSAQRHVIEMDLCEMFFYYGIFGFIVMALPYLRRIWEVTKAFFTGGAGFHSFCVLISIFVCCGYLTIAGHVLFSVTGGFYLAVMLIYASIILQKKDENDGLQQNT